MSGLNDIQFIKGQGGLGRPLAGEDHISGLLVFTGNLPSGFSAAARNLKVLSIEDAEALGIVNDLSDETVATGSVTITAVGTNTDTIVIAVTRNGIAVELCSVEKTATESTVTLLADKIVAAINLGTHGYTAANAAGVITITAPAGTGASLNSGTPIAVTIDGTITATIVQFSGGVYSKLSIYHYHISEFFRLNPKGVLWIGCHAVPVSTYDFSELVSLQQAAQGTIRQVFVYGEGLAYAPSQLATLQSVKAQLETLHMPLSIVYCANIAATANVGTLVSLGTLDAPGVSFVIGQDGGAVGKALFDASKISISCGGALLGAISAAKVSEDIAWVSKFNLSNGIELETLAFANGQKLTDVSVNTLATLNDGRFIFALKHSGIAGSYFNDSHCAVSVSSDYAYIENNRTIDKAIRNIRTALLPDLNSPLALNADGTLTNETIAYFENKAGRNLEAMVRDGELSAFDVVINTAQNVLTTSKLEVTVKLVINGVARNIVVKIGFTQSI